MPRLQRAPCLPLLLALAAAGAVLPARGEAQRVRAVRVELDNDLFGIRGRGPPPDHDYTHGLHASLELAGIPTRRRRADGGAGAPPDRSTTLGLGQEIYTPRVDAAEPVPGERPYAAWLFLLAGASTDRGHRRDEAVLRVGVVGPPALGEPVQNGVHRLTGSRPQLGWAHQLGAGPGVHASFTQTHRLRPAGAAGRLVLLPWWSASLGNVRTGAGAGVAARAGAASGRGAYATAGVRGEYVLRDLFLDAAPRGGAPVRRIRGVGEWEAGAGYAFDRWSAGYRFVVRGREYHGQHAPHAHGSVGLAWSAPGARSRTHGRP